MSKLLVSGFGLRMGLVGVVLVAAACSAGGDTERASSVEETLTIAVPYRVRAIDFAAFNDSDTVHEGTCGSGPVDQQTVSDNGVTCGVAFTKPGEWLEYSLQVATAGKFSLVSRTAGNATGKTIRLLIDGVAVGGSQSVPSAGWTAFADRTVSDVTLNAGTHTLRVLFESGDTNFNYVDVTPGSATVPQRIEAENYQRAFESTPTSNSGNSCNRGDGVDMASTNDMAGGCLVGWATANEWLEYDVTAPTAGLYDFSARLASATAGRQLQLSVDGALVGTVTSPSAGYNAFEDRKVQNVNLGAGPHVVRATFVQGDLNLNYIDVSVHPVLPGYSFGGAVNYNVFVFQDLSVAPSVGGPVAAGRDIISQSFSYNTTALTTIGALAGRNFNGTNGNIQRDIVYGNTVSLSGVTVGQGVSRKATLVDFVAEKSTLDVTTANLANLTANGTTTISPSGTVFTFTGTDPSRNVFSVNGAALGAGDQFTFSVPATSTAVVNVTGTAAAFDSASLQLGSLATGHLLWNFPQATTLRVSSVGVKGTLLAVNAAVTMSSASLDGALLAGSLSGTNTGITWVPFDGSIAVCSGAGLSITPGSPQLVNTPVTLSASATCADGKTAEFHYDYLNSATETTWHEVVSGFGTTAVNWNTIGLPAGTYQVRAQVRRVGETAVSGVSATSSFILDNPVLIPIAAPTVETFNGLGTTDVSLEPPGWRIDKQINPRTVGTFTAAIFNSDFRAGALLPAASSNGIYNFGSGVANAQATNYWLNSTDRAPGWFSAGSALGTGGTKSGNLYVALIAPSNKDITSLKIGYDIEKYSNGTNPAGFRVQLYSSTDGATWTNVGTNFLNSFAANASNLGFDPVPGQTINIAPKQLTASIPRNSRFYLAWNYTVDSASSTDGSNAQALAIDNVSIQGSDVCTPNCTGKTCGSDGCGGLCGQLCTGPGCVLSVDCAGGNVCTGVQPGGTAPTMCQPVGYPGTCPDGIRDGDETDVDCGGSCGPCTTGGGCSADTDCAADLVCGSGNSACFGKARAKNVCWKPSCQLGSDVGGCGLDDSACGKNCSCDDICDSENPNSVCPTGEVCKAGAGRLFGSPSPDACVDSICPSNDPTLCGTPTSLCGQECICTPDCAGATCANPDDHCGGQCPGVCGEGQTGCTTSIQCAIGQVCLPQGDGSTKACVSRSCEGIVLAPPLCGSAGALCGAQCPTCTPSCDGRQCGADPNCGQSCGTCAAGSFCSGDGQCVAPTVEPPLGVPDGNGGQNDVPLLVSTQPTSKVGALNGQFSVSDAGTAQYSIPFDVPPGRAGIQPALSLSYVSSKANGEEGVGWHLDGLPKITRCPRSYGIDGYAAPIKNDTSDLFCMDGKRLEVVQGGTYGGDGAEYRTLIDSFGEIKSFWDAGDGIQLDLTPNLQRVPRGDRGPDRFVVRTKDGKTLTFGTTRDSLVLARNGVRYAWLIKRVEDRAGNYMTVSYENYHANLVQFDQMMSNMVRPSAITYTGHGSNVGSQHVIFEYSTSGERKDSLLTFGQGGAANVVPDRLKVLTTYASGKAIKNYRFHYPDGELSQIDSVQECAGSDQSVCKSATTFEYTVDQGFSLGSQPIAPSDLQSAGRFDTDGDGIPDYLVTTAQQNAVEGSTGLTVAKVSSDVAVAIGAYATGGVGGFAINTFWNVAKSGFWGLFGQSPTYTVKHEIMFGTARDAQLRYKTDVSGIKCNNVDASGVRHPIFLQDFDLDGKDDVVTACGTNFGDLYVARSQGDGTFAGMSQGLPSGASALSATINSVTSSGRGACAACFSRPVPIMLDVNGDSLQDAVTCKDQYTLQLWLRKAPAVPAPTMPSAQTDFEAAVTLNAPPAPPPSGPHSPAPSRPMLPLCAGASPTYNKTFDIDGDGTPDLLVRGPSSWFVLRYTPNVTPALSWQEVDFPDIGGTNGSAGGALTLGDFNGDGLADIANTDNPDQYVIWMNTGGAVFSPVRLANPKPAPALDPRYKRRKLAVLDYNADGRTDLFENWEWIDGDVNTFYALYDRNYSLTPNARFDALKATEAQDAIWLNPEAVKQPMPWWLADDFDGDGNTDLLASQVLYGRGSSNLLLSRVVDGLGNVTTVDYDDSAYQTDDRCTGLQWPETCLKRVHGLVSKHTEGAVDSNGQPVIERSYVYHYVNARVNVTGEGWLSFDRRTVDAYYGIYTLTSASLNTTTIDYEPVARYRPDGTLLEGASWPYVYPLAGLPKVITVDHHVPTDPSISLPPLRDADYEQRTQITNDWQVKQSAHNRPFPFLGTRVTKTYDRRLAGGVIGESTLPFDEEGVLLTDCDVHNTPDGFGNVTYSIEYCQHRENGAVETTETSRGYVSDGEWPTPNQRTLQITSTVPTLNPPSATQSYTFGYQGGLVHDVTRNATDGATSAEQQHKTIYTRNQFGNVVAALEQVPGEADHQTTFAYDTQDLFPKTITTAGQTTQMQFDTGFGHELLVVDPNGIVVASAAYDLFGRQVVSANPTGMTITTFSTGTAVDTPLGPMLPRLVASTDRQGSDGSPGGGGSVALDSHGRVIRTTATGYAGVLVAQETSYDSLGLVRASSIPHAASITTGPVDQYDYDGLQRLIKVTHADGTSRRHEYASFASLKDPLRSWIPTALSLVPVGIVRTIDEKSRENVVVTDYRGRVVRSIDGENVALSETKGASFASSNYYYGTFGNLGWMEDNRGLGSGTLTDAYGRLLARLDPDTGVVNYTYNGFDQLKTSTDFANHRRSYVYDTLGRLRVLDDGAQGATHWDYDQGPNALGRISETTSSTGQQVRYNYEPGSGPSNRGLLSGMTYVVDGLDYSIGLEYDGLGRTKRIHYPTRSAQPPIVAQYGYDPISGALASLSEVGSGTAKPLWQVNQVEQGLLIQSETFGNGATSTYGYSPTRRWLESIQTTLGTTPIQSLGFTHYENGLVHERIEAGGTSSSYDYDLLNRLKKETSTGPSGPVGSDDYTYDDIGNIKARGANESFYVGAKPHLVDSVNGNGYLYDRNGNVSSRMGSDIPGGQQSLHYTPFNLPDLITTGTGPAPKITQFEYSAGEERLVRRDLGVTHRYAASLYEHTVDTTGTTETTIEERFKLFAGNRAIGEIVRKVGADTTQYFHADNLGSIDTLSDGAGNALHQHFDPFGAKRDAPSPALTRAGFTGHNGEDDLGLIDMKGRFYDPLAARFVSPDPQLQAPFSSQGQNRYSYVFNNPVNNTDPTGFRVADWLGYAIDGTIGGGTVAGLAIGIAANSETTAVSVGSVASSAGPGAGMAGSGLGGTIAGVGGYALANVAVTFAIELFGGPSMNGALPGGFETPVPTPSAAHRSVPVGASSWLASTQSTPVLDPCPGAGVASQAKYIGAGLRDYNPIYMLFGSDAHRAIELDYREKHAGRIFTEQSVTTIARILGKTGSAGSILSFPDIFNSSTRDLYEIKSVGNEGIGLEEAEVYVAQLKLLGVPAGLGVASASGTVNVWGYTVDYWSPQAGVIVYERVGFRGPGLDLNLVPLGALPWLFRELMKVPMLVP